MTHNAEVEGYVKDPSLLVDLCREVIERLEAGTDNGKTAAMEAQLLLKLSDITVALPPRMTY